MKEFLLAIGTRKGLFFARRRDGDRGWDIEGPHLLMNSVDAIGLDLRCQPPRFIVGTSHGHWGPALHRSDDFGSSWQETAKGAVRFPSDSETALEKFWQIQPAGADQPGVIYAGTGPAALFRSDDGGVTFALVDGLWNHPHRKALIEWLPEAGALYLHTVVFHPSDSNVVTVGISAGGVYRSTDGGTTWAARNVGIEVRTLPDRYPEFGQCVHKIVMDAMDPARLYLQNHGGVYRSDDDGGSWVPIHNGLPADFGFAMAGHPRRAGMAYVFPLVADTERIPPEQRCRVYRTDDAGQTWRPLSCGLPGGGYYGVVLRDALHATGGDPADVYFGSRLGDVYASHDDGETWAQVVDHLPDVLCLRGCSRENGQQWS